MLVTEHRVLLEMGRRERFKTWVNYQTIKIRLLQTLITLKIYQALNTHKVQLDLKHREEQEEMVKLGLRWLKELWITNRWNLPVNNHTFSLLIKLVTNEFILLEFQESKCWVKTLRLPPNLHNKANGQAKINFKE